MDQSELRRHQITSSTFKHEIDLLSNCPIKVTARGIHGKDYFEQGHHYRWNGMHCIIHVASALFHIAQCNSGTEILVYKQTKRLSFDERLQDLCDTSQLLELSIVFRHNKQTML